MNLGKGHSLSIVLSSGADCDVHVTYRDEAKNGTLIPGAKNTAFTAATTGTEILAGPGDASHVRKVTALVVRNIDSSSNDVTIKHSDGTTTVALRKVTLGGGDELHYNEGDGWATITASAGAEWTTIVLTADVANSAADTLANVTGLTFAVDANDTYEFEAHIDYTADATTSGSRWTVNGPAVTRLSYTSEYSLTTTTVTKNTGLTAVQLPAAANATSAATGGNIAKVNGFITPSAAGTFAIQSAAEAGTITAKAGSTLRWRKVVNA
jgi:hypothetical protein